MSINQLKAEIAEVGKQILETESRRQALATSLDSVINEYFIKRITEEKNPELRRDFAYLNSSKRFEIINGTILRFTGRNISGPITFDISVSDILQ